MASDGENLKGDKPPAAGSPNCLGLESSAGGHIKGLTVCPVDARAAPYRPSRRQAPVRRLGHVHHPLKPFATAARRCAHNNTKTMAELNRAALEAMRDAAMATAQAQLKLAAACAAALGEDAPKLTKDGRKARGKREKDPNRPAYAETASETCVEIKCRAPTPSTRCRLRSCVCSMAWSFQAVDAILSP